ncbi:hypothetical protein FSC37_06705 [Piscinibacter aquaticus]|uniref:Uncharacterized protein n=1 Tax=Piscinibacter aquaticus TaxID=392597 RepID=A0A5C6TYZ4_9BURK|nr:hypothetical protein FSC37_06705 [Piscinibacter aquaticus]
MLGWLRQGAADVAGTHDLRSPGFGARLRVAVERRRIEREARQPMPPIWPPACRTGSSWSST